MIKEMLKLYIAGLNYADLLEIANFARNEEGRRNQVRILMHPKPTLNKDTTLVENMWRYHDKHKVSLMEARMVVEFWWKKP